MKKSLIALAALASFAGIASAQSSVTLFGIVDATLAYGKGTVSNKTQLTNSGYNSSRLGFRGTEDLGGGMSASFWLEAGMSNDDGQGAATNSNNQASGVGAAVAGRQGLTFNRRSTVSLAGGFGEVRLGRDYTPQFWNLTVFDPFGTNGVGTNQIQNSIITGVTSTRASNTIGYFLPGNLGGFYGQVQYYLGENNSGAATSKDGRGAGIRVGFANGPFNVAVATSRTKYAAGNTTQSNIGGMYDFGMAKVMGQYSRDKNDALGVGGATGKGWLIGGLVPVGAGEIRLAYSRYEVDTVGTPESKKIALGYVHNLSKRTALYTTFARVKNSGGAASSLNGSVTAANGKSTGYDFGIRHSF
jgi:predicted porin